MNLKTFTKTFCLVELLSFGLEVSALRSNERKAEKGRQLKKGKSGKGDNCLKYKWELEVEEGYEGLVDIYSQYFVDDGFSRRFYEEDFDTDLEFGDLGKLKSCDQHCFDPEEVTGLSVTMCSDSGDLDDIADKIKVELGDAKFEFPKEDSLPSGSDDQCGTCCKFIWDEDVESIVVDCYNQWCRRRKLLGDVQVEANTFKFNKPKHFSPLATQDNLLSSKAAGRAHRFLASAWENGAVDSTKKSHNRNLNEKDYFEVELTGEQTVEVLGASETQKLLDFYIQSMGRDVPVTKVRLQHHDYGDEKKHQLLHSHDESELIVFISEDINGGGVAYVNKEDRTIVPDAGVKTGTAIVHGENTLHGAHGWTGTREVLIFFTDYHAKSEDCMLKPVLTSVTDA